MHLAGVLLAGRGPVRSGNRFLRHACRCTSESNGAAAQSLTASAPTTSSSIPQPPKRYTYEVQGYGSHPPPVVGSVPAWTSEVVPAGGSIPVQRQIFCNRALNMKQIKAVGFDMDYTLAQYKPQTFEGLAHKETVRKLVEVFRYPPELLSLDFKWDYMTKGLIMDRATGNVLKVDRHSYVKVAYHGFRQLTHEERKDMYNNSHLGGGGSFDDARYAMVDTLFSLAEAYLFMQVVDLKDSGVHEVLVCKTYSDLYKDLRAAVDMCHRDGSLKRAVAHDPPHFIHKDPLLKEVLLSLRRSGRQVFLATNSLWDYTNVVMNYLLLDKIGPCKSLEWLRYFDVVLTGCAKPSFFQHRAPLFAVDAATGHLLNTDNGAPIVPIDEDDLSPHLAASSSAPQVVPELGKGACPNLAADRLPPLAHVFQGGWYLDLHKMLAVRSGNEVLYVGDHIYGDIVKSKKYLGWRTMLVVPELELELEQLRRSSSLQRELRALREARDQKDDRIQRLRWSLESRGGQVAGPQDTAALSEMLSLAEAERAAMKRRHSQALATHHARFHPIWGQLLKTGHQNSRFAHQVERYACLYTSHVSNLAFVSPDKSYMGRVDVMAHEHGPE